MHIKTPPTGKTIDSFWDQNGNEYGLYEITNKYGRGEKRYYLEYNGEAGSMPYSRSAWKRLKKKLDRQNLSA